MIARLLDVNLLLALTDPRHVHHPVARRWFVKGPQQAWATCPLTENGFLRIASHPQYPNRPGGVDAVLAVLRQFCSTSGHVFWHDEISLRDRLTTGLVITHQHVTDVYLLALAVARGGRLATLDRSIPAGAVAGGEQALEVIQP